VKLYVRFRWIALVALFPFLVLGLAVLVSRVYDLVRYDPTYFADVYLERYDRPGELARDLEEALQTGDTELLAELQGLRWPAEFPTSPDITFIMLWERTDRFITYLFFNNRTYERQPQYVEERGGRWVVSPEDLHYYLHSGKWREVFLPLAIVWWLVGFLAIAMVWLFRASETMRARLYGE
jgi:hypothetical protein